MGVNDALQLRTTVDSLLETREDPMWIEVNGCKYNAAHGPYSDGLAGSMMTASFDFSSVTR